MPTIPTLTDKIIAAIGSSRSAQDMAAATYDALCAAATEADMKPEIEVAYQPPGGDCHHGDLDQYWVAWEAGPYRWAPMASVKISEATGKTVTAPQGFSLQFNPQLD